MKKDHQVFSCKLNLQCGSRVLFTSEQCKWLFKVIYIKSHIENALYVFSFALLQLCLKMSNI